MHVMKKLFSCNEKFFLDTMLNILYNIFIVTILFNQFKCVD